MTDQVRVDTSTTARVALSFNGHPYSVPLFDRPRVDDFDCDEPYLSCSACESEEFQIYWVRESGVLLFVCAVCEGICFAVRPAGDA